MPESLNNPVLAIDGGGTKCRLALQTTEACLVAEAGPANASTDFDAAINCLLTGLAALAKLADTKADTLYGLPAFVGLAGVTGPSLVARLTAALPLRNVCYADDRRAALHGALGDDDGLLAHCGTGSFFASKIGKKERFAGGWGAVLGDEASAQWVGRMALNQLLRQVDGLIQGSELTEELMAQFQDAANVVQFARDASPADFGGLAPLVTARATSNDPVAHTVLQAGANHIASELKQMGWVPGLAVCLAGGIGPYYATYLPDDMKPDLAKPQAEPLDGAIALARNMEVNRGHS